MSNVQLLEAVGPGSETELQLGDNINTAGKGLLLTHRLPTLLQQ